MASRLRSRELRLGRSFREIVLSVVASPLLVACSTAETGASGGVDATAADSTTQGAGDASGDAPANPLRDAGIDGSDSGPSEACDTLPYDGAAIEGDMDGCVRYRSLPCGLPATAQFEGCAIDLATCLKLCDCDPSDAGFFIYCQLSALTCDDAGNQFDAGDAASVVEFVSCNGISGRRPLGLAPPRVPRRTPLGDYFAASAHLESASVRAFRDLAGWLGDLGAPRRLVSAARRAAQEERRHARAAARLARRFGGRTAPPRARRVLPPTLVELLVDDAVEGCVKETFGALLATWQAANADDARIRRTMGRVALDETRHSALAWEILAWGMNRLPRSQRGRVEDALDRALRTLETTEPPKLDPALHAIAGHPRSEQERRLVNAFARLVREQRASLLGQS